MKRTRATEPSTSIPPSKLISTTQKTHKKSKEPINPKSRTRRSNGVAAAAHEVKEEQGDRPIAEGCHHPLEEVEVGVGLGFGDREEEGFGLWCGSVEEELLLGWFPWAGPIWEEVEDDDEEKGREYGDIWQLQHIHEIPNPLK